MPSFKRLLCAGVMGSSSSAAYTTQGRDFDGTNDYATRGANLTGIADGKAGVLSLWLRLDGGDGVTQLLMATNTVFAGSKFFAARGSANFLQVGARNAAGTQILNVQSSNDTAKAAAAWKHMLASWDLAAGVSRLYVDGVDAKFGGGTQTNDTIAYTTDADFSIGSYTTGGAKLNGCLSEVFFHASYLDISVEANRRLFRSATGKPVNLGTDGSTPLGVRPLIYMPYGDPSDNKGSGGNFTITGALDVASTSPSD